MFRWGASSSFNALSPLADTLLDRDVSPSLIGTYYIQRSHFYHQ